MNRLTRRAAKPALALAVMGALVALVASSAGAAQPKISVFRSGAKVAPQVASSYLSGYQVTEPGISYANVSFTVPTMNCPTTDTQGVAAGIGNEATAGAPTVLAVVFLACSGGAPLQEIQVTAGAGETFGTVAPGDKVNLIITQSRKKVTATVTDTTTHIKTTASGTPTPDNTLVFGTFPLFSGSMLGVADFGTLKMKQPTLENSDLSTWSPSVLTRTVGAVTEISTGKFAGSGTFSQVFRSN